MEPHATVKCNRNSASKLLRGCLGGILQCHPYPPNPKPHLRQAVTSVPRELWQPRAYIATATATKTAAAIAATTDAVAATAISAMMPNNSTKAISMSMSRAC